MSVKNAINWRKAVKIYDNSKSLTNEQIKEIVDAGRMAPSSLGLETNSVIVVRNKTLKNQIANQAMMQSNIEKTLNADSLVIIVGYKNAVVKSEEFLLQRAKRRKYQNDEEITKRINYYKMFLNTHDEESLEVWVRNQGFITLAFMMLQASDLQIGSTPAEGFKKDILNKILAENNLINLNEQEAHITLFLGSYNENTEGSVLERIRLPFDQFAQIID